MTEVEPASPVTDGVTAVINGNLNGGHVVFTEFFSDFSRSDGELRSAFATDLLEAEVVEIVLRGSGILRRIEVHGGEGTANRVVAEAVQAPLPFADEHFVFTRSGVVVAGNVGVGVHIQAEVHPFIVDNISQSGSAVATSMDSTLARSRGRVLTIVGQVEVALHGPGAVGASKVVQDVEITILAFGNEDVELEVVVTILFVAEEEDLVVAIGEVTALGAFEIGNHTVFVTAGSVAPSGPPVVTGSNSLSSDLVTNSVLFERFEEQHLVVALQRDFEVVEIVLRSSGILGREEVHGAEDAVSLVLTEAVHAPLPFGIEFFRLTNHIEVKLGNVVVGIDMDAEVHPFVVDARQVAGTIATSVHGAVTRSLGRVLTIVGHVHVNLHGPSAVATSKVVQHIEVTVLAFRNESVELEVINARRVVTKLDDLVVTIGEVSGHGTTSHTEDTVFSTARSVAPSGPRITKGLSDFGAFRAIIKIEMQLSESIAANKGNHRNE